MRTPKHDGNSVLYTLTQPGSPHDVYYPPPTDEVLVLVVVMVVVVVVVVVLWSQPRMSAARRLIAL